MLTKDSKNILVADDSLFFRSRLSSMLTEAGHGVKFAKNGKEAIHKIQSSSDGIDLLVLDLQMPEVDGFGVLKWINENGYRGRFPILAITGAYEPMEVIDNLKTLGASGFMSKNLLPEQVIFRVNRLLFTDKAATGVKRERAPVSIPVDFTFRDTTYTGTIINISEGGVFLYTDVKLLKGAMLQLKFSLPGIYKVLEIKGIVRWSPDETADNLIFCGYGIMFISMSQEEQEALKDFIANEIAKVEK